MKPILATLLVLSAALPARAADAPAKPVKTEYAVTTVIHAPADKIWGILTDTPKYPQWAMGVSNIEGKVGKDEHIVVHVKFAEEQAFNLTVTDFQPNKQMVWTGGMPLGLFKAERTYKLTPLADGYVQFDMREAFTGPMAGMIAPSMPDLQPMFDAFGSGLKKRAEAG
ncbi:MAG: hypothetical protein JWM80_2168 [Cyanobacteria bacterium RYN_339]|nr:hypothetical protein [Cyanobacteria bacterium RYN_339]